MKRAKNVLLCARKFSMSTSTVSKEQNFNLAKLPIGVGLPHGSSGQSITIFGSTGFVARYVVNELGYNGPVITAATRGDDMSWRHLRPLCDLGRLVPSYYDLKDDDAVRAAIAGSDVVINLQGKHYETKHYLPMIINWNFEDLHIKGAQKLARIAREEDVKHFVQLSSLATEGDEESMSRWALSKKRGDEAVKSEFPGATIVKSNVIFGEEDRLLNWFAKQMVMYPVIPLFNGGSARIQPVYVGDVAKALALIAQDYSFCDETVYLNGPHEYSYKQIAEWVAEQIDREVTFVEVPQLLQKYFGQYFNLFPNPRWTEDLITLLKQDQVLNAKKGLDFTDLGITPQQLEVKGFNAVFKYKIGGHFADPKSREVAVHS